MDKKILVVSAHPDDETLGAGGTLLKHKENSDKLYWMTFTISNDDNSFKEARLRTIQEVAREYEYEDVINLDFISTLLETYKIRTLFDSALKIIKKIKPDYIYTVGSSDVNTEHDLVYKIIMGVTRPSYIKIKGIYAYEIPSSTNWSFGEKSSWFIPHKYVVIDNFIEKKLAILTKYKDQIFEYPHARSLEAVEALAKYRGSSIGSSYAESFMILREIWQ